MKDVALRIFLTNRDTEREELHLGCQLEVSMKVNTLLLPLVLNRKPAPPGQNPGAASSQVRSLAVRGGAGVSQTQWKRCWHIVGTFPKPRGH